MTAQTVAAMLLVDTPTVADTADTVVSVVLTEGAQPASTPDRPVQLSRTPTIRFVGRVISSLKSRGASARKAGSQTALSRCIISETAVGGLAGLLRVWRRSSRVCTMTA